MIIFAHFWQITGEQTSYVRRQCLPRAVAGTGSSLANITCDGGNDNDNNSKYVIKLSQAVKQADKFYDVIVVLF